MGDVLSQLWHKFKWLPAFLVFLIGLIDPKRVDELGAAHPRYESVILSLFALILSYRGKSADAGQVVAAMIGDEKLRQVLGPQVRTPDTPAPPKSGSNG